MKIQPARRVAYEVLRAVSDSDAYANLLLPVGIGRAGLGPADAGLATELTYGTLRRIGYYDAVIELATEAEDASMQYTLVPGACPPSILVHDCPCAPHNKMSPSAPAEATPPWGRGERDQIVLV